MEADTRILKIPTSPMEDGRVEGRKRQEELKGGMMDTMAVLSRKHGRENKMKNFGIQLGKKQKETTRRVFMHVIGP